MKDLTIVKNQVAAVLSFQDNYSYQTRAWVRWMKETDNRIDEDGIGAYFRWLNNDSGLAAGTIRNRRQAAKKRVKQIYQTAPTETRIKIDYVLKKLDEDFETAAPKIQDAAVPGDKVITDGEYKAMLSRALNEPRRLVLMLLRETALRVSELVNIKISDCNGSGESVRVRVMGKGKKERMVRIRWALFSRCLEVFNGYEYLIETGNHNPMRRSQVYHLIRSMGRTIGREISPHCLRHSWATKKYKTHPEQLGAISAFLGHSSTAITMSMYVHTELSDDELFDDVVDLETLSQSASFDHRQAVAV